MTGTVPALHHRRPDDVPEQRPVEREGGAGALAGDLAGRAAEVEVDVVDPDLVDQASDGPAHDAGIDARQLHAAYRLVGAEGRHAQGLGVALDQGPGRDHLADVEPGAVAAAEGAEGTVGHPGHGGEHDGQVDHQVPELELGGWPSRPGRTAVTTPPPTTP